MEHLRALGCDIAQGYHLSRPLCDADFTAWLELSNRSLIGVTDLSEERDHCSKYRDSQSGSAGSPRCPTPPSRSATGSVCGLIGPNGAGKTTLFNCISRLYEPAEGRSASTATTCSRRAHEIAALGIARTFQNLASCRR